MTTKVILWIISTAAVLTVVTSLILLIVGIIGQAINQAHSWEEWTNQDDRKGNNEEL